MSRAEVEKRNVRRFWLDALKEQPLESVGQDGTIIVKRYSYVVICSCEGL
jgi:hypothetical protein